jgi:uncharacterized membrane protein (UPF0127 family)
MNKFKRYLLPIILVVILVLGFFFWEEKVETDSAEMIQTYQIKIARTKQEQAKGFMFKKNIKDDEGLLFVFDHPHVSSFWMKDTFVPLTIFWINEDRKIIGLSQMRPCIEKKCKIYSSKSEVKFAFEIKQLGVENARKFIGKNIEFAADKLFILSDK